MISAIIKTIKNAVSFHHPNSNRVLNGSVDELGTQLVTNGDFSAVPLGSELAIALTSWTAYTSGASTVTYDGSTAKLNIDSASNGGSNVGIYQDNIFTVGKSYKIVLRMKATALFDAEIVEANNAATLSTIGTASLTTSYQNFTFNFIATGTFDLFIHRLFNGVGASQTIFIESVSVKEVLNIVTNGDFSATGAEVAVNGDFAINSAWGSNNTISSGQLTKTAAGLAFQEYAAFTSAAKSYKCVVDVAEENGVNFTLYVGGAQFALNVGVNTLYIVNGTSNPYLGFNDGNGSIVNSISIKELGEGWSQTGDVSFNSLGAFINVVDGAFAKCSQSITYTIGKSYKVSFDLTGDGSDRQVRILDQGANNGGLNELLFLSTQTPTTHTFYFVANNQSDSIYFKRNNSGDYTFTIDNISVQELGADWTATKAVVTFANNQMTVDDSLDDGQDSRGTQIITTEVGRIYNLTFNRISTTSTFYLAVGSNGTGNGYKNIFFDNLGASTGVYTLQFTALSTTTHIGLITSGTSVSVYSDVSVQEVGQNWTLGAGWSVGNRKLIANDPDGYASQSGVFEAGVSKYYKIKLKVEDYSSGSFKVITQGNTAQSQIITANNDYEFDFLSNSPTGSDLLLSFDGNFVGSITRLEVKERISSAPELSKVKDLTNGRIYALKQADGAVSPCVIIQLIGCEPNHTKDGGSTIETNTIEITCIAQHPRTAFQIAALLRMGFNKSGVLTDENEGVSIDEMIFTNWASDIFEPTDLHTMTLSFDAFSSLRQDLTNYLN